MAAVSARPARSGSAASQITAANAATLKVRWTRPAPGQANLMSNPALVHHHVFVADGQGHLYSYRTGGALARGADFGGFTRLLAGGRRRPRVRGELRHAVRVQRADRRGALGDRHRRSGASRVRRRAFYATREDDLLYKVALPNS